MMNNFFKKNWEHIAAVAIFLVISMIYFSPALDGYSIKMGDIKSGTGMSKETKDFREMYDEQTLWTSTSFSGMPGYMINTHYNHPIKTIQSFFIDLLSFPIYVLFMAFLCFYILALSFNAGFYISLIGALGYGLATYNFTIIEAGHVSKMMAIAYIPGVIAGMVMLYRRKNWILSLAILALFFTLELMVNHVQMTYYFIFIMVAFGIAEFFRYLKQKNLKAFAFRTALIFLAGFIALLANFGRYYNNYKFAKNTMRGKPIITISATENVTTDDRTPEQIAYDEFNTNTGGLKRDYITKWCYGKAETWNLFIPTAKGDSKNVTGEVFDKLKEQNPRMYNEVVTQYQKNQGKIFSGYWGDQPFTSGPSYMGAIIIFLALMYLFFVHNPLKWALLGITIFTIMLSWGKNLGGSIEDMWLTNFFIDYFPLYSKFRAVSSILVVVNLAAPIMAILFLINLTKNLEWAKKNIKWLGLGAGVVVFILLVLAIKPNMVGLLSEYESQQLSALSEQYVKNPQGYAFNPHDVFSQVTEIRASVFRADTLRTLGLIALVIGLMFLFIRNEKLKNLTLGGVALLILIDLFSVGKRYLNNEKNPNNPTEYLSWKKGSAYDNNYFATNGDQQIYQMEASQNPNIQNQVNERMSLLEASDRNRMNQESIMFSSLNFNTNYRVMDLDNPFNSSRASYFHKTTGGYSPAKLKRYQDIIDFYISNEIPLINTGKFENMKVLNMLNNKYYLYQGNLAAVNPKAFGNAWFVDNVKWVSNSNEEILAIKDVNLKSTAIIHESFKKEIKSPNSYDSSASISMTNYLPNHITYQASCKKNQLAVFSEVYYKDGWNAYIDGSKTPYARANYIVRAINIPAGEHTIEFKFEPTMYKTGNTVNLVGFLLIIGIFGFAGFNWYKDEKRKSEDKQE